MMTDTDTRDLSEVLQDKIDVMKNWLRTNPHTADQYRVVVMLGKEEILSALVIVDGKVTVMDPDKFPVYHGQRAQLARRAIIRSKPETNAYVMKAQTYFENKIREYEASIHALESIKKWGSN